jgi:hypothetical protein
MQNLQRARRKKPFLYIGPNESHVTDIIRQYDAYVSSHGDVEGVVTNILHAMRNIVLGSPRGVEVETLFSKNRLIPQMISLTQVFAAKYQLERSGRCGRIHIGVAKENGQFLPHAWLECEGETVLSRGVEE